MEFSSFGELTRTENFLVDSKIGYPSWEESFLVKFSEFLGFLTKSHEREILYFLRSLAAKHNQMRSKGQHVVSRCERELKKLECTINYKGQWNEKRTAKNPMKLKIMSWNVRGVNNRDKRKVLKAFIRSKKVDIVCLQETKIQNMSVGIVRSLGVGRFLDWGTVDAKGSSEGILVFWDKRVVELIDMEIGIFSVSCYFRNCTNGFQWMFS